MRRTPGEGVALNEHIPPKTGTSRSFAFSAALIAGFAGTIGASIAKISTNGAIVAAEASSIPDTEDFYASSSPALGPAKDFLNLERGTSIIGERLCLKIRTQEGVERTIVFSVEKNALTADLIFTVDGKTYENTDELSILGKLSTYVTDVITEKGYVRIETKDQGYGILDNRLLEQALATLADADTETVVINGNVDFVATEGSSAEIAQKTAQAAEQTAQAVSQRFEEASNAVDAVTQKAKNMFSGLFGKSVDTPSVPPIAKPASAHSEPLVNGATFKRTKANSKQLLAHIR